MLPQPWLPLKKGQTLVNRETTVPSSNGNEAVVLTLRKRYSTIRKGKRRRTISGAHSQEQGSGREGYSDADPTLGNPWSDLRTDGPQSAPDDARRVRNRLSFDDATRIIVLPEDAQWLMENVESDSEEDYGNDTTPPSPDSAHVNGSSSASTALDPAGASSSPASATMASPSKARHGTYFHHPERRKQTIPGAFPRS